MVLAAVAVIVAGFLGFDRWFYEHVQLVLETKDRPLDRDFYAITAPLWLACRYTFAHVLGVLVIFAVVAAVHRRRLRAAVAGFVCVLGAAAVANLLQGLIGRLRPDQADSALAFVPFGTTLINKQNVCFPSGEAAMAFALACTLAHLFPQWRAVFYVGGSLAAVARLINGAHYVSDVVAGALLGHLVADCLWRQLAAHEQQWLAWLPAGAGGDAKAHRRDR